MNINKKVLLDRTTNNGFRYRLRQITDEKFVIFSCDTKTIMPETASIIDWKEEAIFNNEAKARGAFAKFL